MAKAVGFGDIWTYEKRDLKQYHGEVIRYQGLNIQMTRSSLLVLMMKSGF
ncbi:MAG: hypothetical protein ACI8ZB_005005 [Desulforhopalus sp.]|jgi:hypothetical protein